MNLITDTFPGHDPPVAWRLDDGIGYLVPIVCCPAIPEDDPQFGYFDDLPISVLDSEPGRRS